MACKSQPGEACTNAACSTFLRAECRKLFRTYTDGPGVHDAFADFWMDASMVTTSEVVPGTDKKYERNTRRSGLLARDALCLASLRFAHVLHETLRPPPSPAHSPHAVAAALPRRLDAPEAA
jgi:hypothetical protein